MTAIDCQCYKPDGICTHQAAPRAFFGPARCILLGFEEDPRIIRDCALKVPHVRPSPPPPPPKRKTGPW